MDFEVSTMVPMWVLVHPRSGEEDGLQFIIRSSPKKETIGIIGVRFEHKILAPTSLNACVSDI
jgi:hypothetical protein